MNGDSNKMALSPPLSRKRERGQTAFVATSIHCFSTGGKFSAASTSAVARLKSKLR
jgi:hypothetical protein